MITVREAAFATEEIFYVDSVLEMVETARSFGRLRVGEARLVVVGRLEVGVEVIHLGGLESLEDHTYPHGFQVSRLWNDASGKLGVGLALTPEDEAKHEAERREDAAGRSGRVKRNA